MTGVGGGEGYFIKTTETLVSTSQILRMQNLCVHDKHDKLYLFCFKKKPCQSVKLVLRADSHVSVMHFVNHVILNCWSRL